MSDQEIAIRVQDIHKSFKLPHTIHKSVKGLFINIFRRRTFEKQVVLNGISFDVKKGEFFGIVGRNGGGKSTLLKLLAGIYVPDSGHIEINGKLTPFIELGVGFNPELTGKENVYLNGALLGFSRSEMDAIYDDIVSFAELEKFMDQKLRNYSSGMQVRLAFSVAIQARTDILLIDEVLAVGDSNFQRKCFDVFEQFKKEGRTVIFISHSMEMVQRFCDRAVLVSKGKVVKEGDPEKIAYEYEMLNSSTFGERKNAAYDEWGKKELEVLELTVTNGKKPKEVFKRGENIHLKYIVKNNTSKDHEFYIMNGCFRGASKVFSVDSYNQKRSFKIDKKSVKELELELSTEQLVNGDYRMSFNIHKSDTKEPLHARFPAASFSIFESKSSSTQFSPKHKWTSNEK